MDAAPMSMHMDAAPMSMHVDAAPMSMHMDKATKSMHVDAAPVSMHMDAAPMSMHVDAAPMSMHVRLEIAVAPTGWTSFDSGEANASEGNNLPCVTALSDFTLEDLFHPENKACSIHQVKLRIYVP
eukprot:365313-Chlamydomonas_euryale.AAC.7